MSTSRFDSGIQLLDKVVIQLNNLEKSFQLGEKQRRVDENDSKQFSY